MSPVSEWAAGSSIANSASAPPLLEGNYRDRNLDREGNTPAFQRSCYLDGDEQQPWDRTASIRFHRQGLGVSGAEPDSVSLEVEDGLNLATSHRAVILFGGLHPCISA